MKRKTVLCVLLALLMLCPLLAGCHLSSESDFVDDDEFVVDNDIPFLYVPPTTRLDYGGYLFYFVQQDSATALSEFYKLFGRKVIHHYVSKDGETETYYSIYAEPDNRLFYLFLKPDGNGGFTVDLQSSGSASVVSNLFEAPIIKTDQPHFLLGDRKPAMYTFDGYTPEWILRNAEMTWDCYHYLCALLGLPDEKTLLLSHGDNVKTFIRCVQSVSFDYIHDNTGSDGLYGYDILILKDGTATLHFIHCKWVGLYGTTVTQEETVPLTGEESEALQTILDRTDFENIPIWNPCAQMGFDGETTYLYSGPAYNGHLISMWQSDARYGIYEIRTLIEETVKAHFEVEEGYIYRPETTEK